MFIMFTSSKLLDTILYYIFYNNCKLAKHNLLKFECTKLICICWNTIDLTKTVDPLLDSLKITVLLPFFKKKIQGWIVIRNNYQI